MLQEQRDDIVTNSVTIMEVETQRVEHTFLTRNHCTPRLAFHREGDCCLLVDLREFERTDENMEGVFASEKSKPMRVEREREREWRQIARTNTHKHNNTQKRP
jgi:hypothetical protein